MIEGSPNRLLLTIEDAARELSIGRSLMYELVIRGEVPSVKIGRCRRVACSELGRYVEQLTASGGDLRRI